MYKSTDTHVYMYTHVYINHTTDVIYASRASPYNCREQFCLLQIHFSQDNTKEKRKQKLLFSPSLLSSSRKPSKRTNTEKPNILSGHNFTK